MKISINRIADAGNLERERVILKALEDVNLTHYAIFSCIANDPEKFIGGQVPNVYWFWNKPLKKGDLVILYTKSGSPSEKPNKYETTSYFYYWHQKSPVWVENRRCVIVNTAAWKSLDPGPDDEDTLV